MKKFVEVIICDSKQDYQYFNRGGIKNLTLIENGIDFEKFSVIQRNPQKGRFLYFGRIDKNKGIDLLFNTLSLIKNEEWHLDIVGDGTTEYLNFLKQLAIRLEISSKITWHGFIPENELFKYLSSSHLCFFPSTYEGFGFTLVEAMASGTVCVANKIEPYCEVVEDNKNSFLVEFSDYKNVVKKIKTIINLPESYLDKIGQEAKISVKKYDWEKKINQIVEIYKNVTK